MLKGFQMQSKMDLLMKKLIKDKHSLMSERNTQVVVTFFIFVQPTVTHMTQNNVAVLDCCNVTEIYHDFLNMLHC